ncbi:VOC family protein [Actinocrispum wychmicini]|uniref:VOC domain-containing protein n=1 Tax=Actinocrispum wychmicini TaxID=1213861 RepID=A0A4R2ISU2_9PSEU|nr:VOC family protein [Actinocrispum wychmicini]TCO48127.1 hypothetical protein EV192_116180 [Actinocrispum wychmicini]
MATRLVNIVIAATDLPGLARFWSALLGWPIAREAPDEVEVSAPADQGWPLDLSFDLAPTAKSGQNRIHLDLASASAADQAAIVERARDLGARSVDIGQRDVPWEVMADPEGNEFCVLEPREDYQNSGALAAVVVEAPDPVALAGFWSVATGWSVGKKVIVPEGDFVGLVPSNGRGPWLEFLPEHGPKTVQNRLHLDVAPYPGDSQEAAVDRLMALGSRRADIGQGNVPWEVMVDPADNEYCILTTR